MFGKSNTSSQGPLDEALEHVEGEVHAKALVQYYRDDTDRRPCWGVALLTDDSLYLVYGEEQSWFGKMFQAGAQSQELERHPYTSIVNVRIPGPNGLLDRLFGSPTRMVFVERREGQRIRISVEKRAVDFVNELARRAT
ncbi:MAG: hypothetical protein ACOC0O_05705 [Spirochaetota bacterium]